MGVKDAKRTTQQIRRAESGADGAAAYTHGQGNVDEESPGSEHLHLGADRADCTGGTAGSCLAGGILTQLISQAEDQLREAEECISWYERAKEKARKQLENLKQLQQLAEQEAQDD